MAKETTLIKCELMLIMKGLTVKPVPIPLGLKHPNTPHEVLPQHEFTMGLIGTP